MLLFLVACLSTAFAQQRLKFRVVDFIYDAFDQTARDERFKKIDGSGSLYAIVKVNGDNDDDDLRDYQFNFGNMNHFVEEHDGELWLYVQKNAKVVTINRSNYATISHYDLKTTIEAGKTYRMTLSAQAPVIYSQMVMFAITPADSRAIVTVTKEGSEQGREVLGIADETGNVAKNLEFGTYIYEVMAENYHHSEGRFTLDNKAETHIEKVSLRSNGANITLETGVNAEIYVNGNLWGSGRWAGIMKAGNYTVECRLPNHRPSQQNINVEEGKARTFQLASPTPITGTLSVNSHPLGADIKIDGKEYGTTPRNIQDLLIGHHNVVISKNGYAPITEECNIRENETLSLELTLKKSQGGTNAGYKAAPQGKTSASDRTFKVGNVSFTMKLVAGGTFTMGTSDKDLEAGSNERPVHQVSLKNYYIGETEVTQELWKAVMGNNPSFFDGNNLPVENISWEECQEFIRKLNARTGQKFRLPTEAEWEYAARGGKNSKGYKYSGSNNPDDVSWHEGNSSNKTHAVKTKLPNELGLYDMSGNVWEWCSDRYGDYTSVAQRNPAGPNTGAFRVNRGGGWSYGTRCCRVSARDNAATGRRDGNLGLRLVM